MVTQRSPVTHLLLSGPGGYSGSGSRTPTPGGFQPGSRTPTPNLMSPPGMCMLASVCACMCVCVFFLVEGLHFTSINFKIGFS